MSHLTAFVIVSLSLPALAGDPALRTPSRSYSTGLQAVTEAYRPEALALGDLDGDGDVDVAFAQNGNWISAHMSFHLNEGDGSFGPPQLLPAFGEAMDVVAEDLDGDGDLDLAFSQSDNGISGSSVLIFRNNGDATFQPEQRFTTDLGPVGLIAFDADGDGDLDLATANWHWNSRNVSLLLNDGNAGFGTRSEITLAGKQPYRLAAGDLDGDGDEDLVISVSSSQPTVGVLMGDGNGDFGAPSYYSGSSSTNLSVPAVVIADVDLDGDQDIVGSSFLYRNQGSGTAFVATQHPAVFVVPSFGGLSVADVTGDGWPDLLGTGHSSKYGWALLANDGAGSFTPAVMHRSGEMARDVAAADLDADGDLDVVIANPGSNTFTVHENEGGTFSMPPVLQGGSWGREMAVGDLDGDGDLDAVSADTTVYVHMNDGTGALGTWSFAPGLGSLTYPELVDMDGDGLLDLVLKAGSIHIAPGRGDGTFSSIRSFAVGGASGEFVTPDLDGDGDPDVVVAGTSSVKLFVFENLGNFQLSGPTTITDFTISGGPRLVAGDVDNDGNVDILQGNGDVVTWLGHGDGTFDLPFLNDTGDGGTQYMLIADYDLDGNLDVACSSYGAGFEGENLVVLRGFGDGGFRPPFLVHGMFSLQYGGVSGLDHYDYDHDGDLDVIGGCYGADDLCLFENNGDGTFAAEQRYGVNGVVLGLRAGDFDGDTWTDVLALVGTEPPIGGGVSVLFAEQVLPSFETYCTAKTNSQGCVPWITASGEARASSTQPFVIEAHDVLNNKVGIFFYGLQGKATIPFQGGLLCAFPPVKRTPLVQSGGNPPPASDCSGVFAFDFNAFMRSSSRPDLVAGAVPHGQFWSRDPQSPSTTGLTDAILIRIKP